MGFGGIRVVVAAVWLAAAGCGGLASGGGDAAGAVDHVGDVLAAGGHEAPGITGLVRYDCGPADELYGIRVADGPVTVDVPWPELAPAVEAADDTSRVQWGPSDGVATAGGADATVVTIVGGGEVSGEDLHRWEDAGLVADVHPCG